MSGSDMCLDLNAHSTAVVCSQEAIPEILCALLTFHYWEVSENFSDLWGGRGILAPLLNAHTTFSIEPPHYYSYLLGHHPVI
jgi:hypothetical protein